VCYRYLDTRNLGNHRLLLRGCGLLIKIAGHAVFEVFCLANVKDLAVLIEHFVNARTLGQRLYERFAVKFKFYFNQLVTTKKYYR
jgi:hypothetical protein